MTRPRAASSRSDSRIPDQSFLVLALSIGAVSARKESCNCRSAAERGREGATDPAADRDAHLARMRRSRPDAPPAEIVTSLEKQFLASVSAIGAASGGAAAAPGVGTAVAFGLTAFEIGGVVEATALFALSVAEIHGVRVIDLERRRTLVTAILFGQSASGFVEKAAGRTGKYWGKNLVTAIPMSVINDVNSKIGKRFITKWGTKQGVLVLGRELPFGIGAGIGAGGNFLVGRGSVQAARRAFGPAPGTWPDLPPASGAPLPA